MSEMKKNKLQIEICAVGGVNPWWDVDVRLGKDLLNPGHYRWSRYDRSAARRKAKSLQKIFKDNGAIVPIVKTGTDKVP